MTQTTLAGATPVEPHARVDDTTALTRVDESYLVSIVEVAHLIVRRNQFFLWAQGVLQSLVPHDILLCGYGDWQRRQFSVDKFASRPFPEPMYEAFCNPQFGLMAQTYATWETNGHAPLPVSLREPRGVAFLESITMLQRYPLENSVFHGVPQVNGSPSLFFCFANLPAPVTRRQAYLIELVAPSLYAAHLRVLHAETRRGDTRIKRESRPPNVALPRSITGREVQILEWVQEGKSNREIGEALQISPLTVKNHVQNILKKLKVRNRAQAVSQAIGACLIQSVAQDATSIRSLKKAPSARGA